MKTLSVNGKAYTIVEADDPEKGKGVRLRDGDTDEVLGAIFRHGDKTSFYGAHIAIPLDVLEHLVVCFNQPGNEKIASVSHEDETIGIP